jgi:Cu/Ag efflux protein CusF
MKLPSLALLSLALCCTPTLADTKAPPRAGQTRGTIQRLDLNAKHLVLQTDQGPQLFVFTVTSRVFRDKEKLGFDKLKPGDRVALSWYRDADGRLTINRLKFALPPVESDQS